MSAVKIGDLEKPQVSRSDTFTIGQVDRFSQRLNEFNSCFRCSGDISIMLNIK